MIIPKGTLHSSLIAYTPIWNKMIWIFLQIIFHDLKIWSALSFRESKLIANHNKHQIEIYVKEFLEMVFAFLLFKFENEWF